MTSWTVTTVGQGDQSGLVQYGECSTSMLARRAASRTPACSHHSLESWIGSRRGPTTRDSVMLKRRGSGPRSVMGADLAEPLLPVIHEGSPGKRGTSRL